ncbi:MAG TPA: SDR family oxidoreductase [Pirellulales bacterium]|nr:SDR family oxidoreductase [Pirellulales bacterium]
MNKRLIFGCGYLGQRVARRWLATGDVVYAVTRNAERAAGWRGEGLRAIVADVTDSATITGLPEVDTVLYAVAHDARSGKTHAETHVVGLGNVLASLTSGFRRLIYISSTGVYGNCQGEWVDEDTPCQPLREAGKACLAAEEMLFAHASGPRAVVLRLAGLYGPGRIPRRDVLLAGEAIDAPQDGFLNLIHVDDAAQAVLAAASVDGALPRRYLVSDGSPVVRRHYYAELARLVGAPPPQFRSPERQTPAALRAAADKRISNARMLAELKINLRFPSFREGLRAIVAEEAKG